MSYDGSPHPPYPFTLLKGEKKGREGRGRVRVGEKKKKGKEKSRKGGGRGEKRLVSPC
jgi:hypothetical protein